MVAETKILGCKYEIPWIILILMQLIIIASVCGEFFSSNWIYGNNFESSLTHLSYNSDSFNIVNDTKSICRVNSKTELCQLLIKLQTGFYSFTILTSIGIIFTIAWQISSIFLALKKNSYLIGCISSFLSLIFYIFAAASWGMRMNVNMTTCNNNKSSPKGEFVCFGTGFKLNFYILGFSIFAIYFFFLIGGISLKKLNLQYFKIKEEEVVETRKNDDTCISVH